MDVKEKNKYRQSRQWKEFRKRILKDRDYTCEVCKIKKKKGLHIHHFDESAYGREKESDVVLLCSVCHRLVEWILSRTKNKIDIDDFCNNLKRVCYRD